MVWTIEVLRDKLEEYLEFCDCTNMHGDLCPYYKNCKRDDYTDCIDHLQGKGEK